MIANSVTDTWHVAACRLEHQLWLHAPILVSVLAFLLYDETLLSLQGHGQPDVGMLSCQCGLGWITAARRLGCCAADLSPRVCYLFLKATMHSAQPRRGSRCYAGSAVLAHVETFPSSPPGFLAALPPLIGTTGS